MKNTILPSITKEKFSKFTFKQKKKLWYNIFLYIEKSLIEKKEIVDLSNNFYLLENEDNQLLKDIYALKNLNSYELYNALRNIFNDELMLQKDFHFLSNIDKSNSKFNLILILDNLRSAFNVGGIIRSAECFGVEELYFCGYTAIPTNQKVSNTSLGCEKFIKWQYCEETIFAINSVRNKGYDVLALEISEKSTSLFEYNFNEKVAIIIGNEALGISDETMSNCDEVIKIPLLGKKQSLNVSVACSIACYEYLKQREYARTSRS